MRTVFAAVLVAGVVLGGVPAGAFAGRSEAQRQTAQSPAPGVVEGVARDAEQRPLPHVRVQVRNSKGQLVAFATTDNTGAFSVTGLAASTYTFEIVNATGAIVGTAFITVSAGATTVVTLTATALGSIATAAAGGAGLLGLGTLATVAVITAASATAVTAVVSTKKDASPSR
jgi:Carboxypeptidase regulatory-like domain